MIISVMLPSLTKTGILIDFKINQDFITEAFCINREKPMTTCNGKCYLSKKLKKAEEQEEKQVPISQKERLEVVYYYVKSSFEFLFDTDNFLSKLNRAYINEFHSFLLITDIFHPPKRILI